MKHIQYICTQLSLLEPAMELLSKEGLQNLYTLEDPSLGGILIGGFAEGVCKAPEFVSLHTVEDPSINWEAQWNEFSPFATLEGDISCSLKAFGGPDILLRLFPGAGFGDLSHPTTQLLLRMMCKTPLSFVVDIGCGSGVLSCAAALLGADKVYGYDIDPLAVHHAKKNTLLNEVQGHVKIGTDPIPHLEGATILLNMTLGEQKKAVANLTIHASTWLVSGIHTDNLERFEAFRIEQGLTISGQDSLEGWHSFILT